ncbi:MAG: UDP-N-acetylglucosamine--N-acetylmuramyl-(pentapeptide) pyrophosphoryl-undecaprenol N-acetylglucosamine transferase [Acidimicrobiia bacterium]
MVKQKNIVIAGGGTGGHVFPALAIARGLEEVGVSKDSIVFFGSNRTLEKDLVPKYGYKLVKFKGKGLNKKEYIKNIYHFFLISIACIKAVILFIINRPKVVIGVGGYASLPAMLAASLLRINRIVHEQNAHVGRTNMLASKLGAAMILTFENTANKPSNSVVLGLPRLDNFDDVINMRRKYLSNKDKRKVVVISGGSLGSQAINDAAIKMLEVFSNDIDFDIVHFAGKNNISKVRADTQNIEHAFTYTLLDFDESINSYYAQSDCVVSRAGAGTCVDLEIISVPCVLIPLPGAPGDHQRHNAQNLLEAGQAELIDQKELNADKLFKSILSALKKDLNINTNVFHLNARNKIAIYMKEKYLK